MIRFQTQVSACSGSPSEVFLWIKEVEMVESVDDFKSSRSIKGTPFPNFEMQDARFAKTGQVWRNKKLRKKIGSFAEERSLS